MEKNLFLSNKLNLQMSSSQVGEQRFGVSIISKIIYGFFAFVLFTFSGLSIVNGVAVSGTYMWLLPVCGVLIGVLLVVSFQIRKVIISEDSILYKGLFSSR
ncbi:hypothetical protein [Pedobacter arcticus]|uniref:hypothetical protein n=1 Tax=Pedobacter arcticus TaxID=752140 RepID=UPI0012B5D046|nr:hypothetical protein [Pedobacter arcticus]